jgi:hypothetical protein
MRSSCRKFGERFGRPWFEYSASKANAPVLLIVFFSLLFLLTPVFATEDRPHMKRIDVSPALPDDGRWLTS